MDYKKLAKKSLDEAKKPKSPINENVRYAEGHNERMDPQLERELKERKHSLGDHPIFPESDEMSFEQKIVGERFEDVMKNYKEKFDVDEVDNDAVMFDQLPMINDCVAIEVKHKKALEDLAVQMIRDEYNISEDICEITVELTSNINEEGMKREKSPVAVDLEFDNHAQIKEANDNVYKRRFLNAMTQGAAKKSTHMFHMVNKELSDLDPRLSTKYGKLIAAADYCYFIVPNMDQQKNGGVVRVIFPTEENPKCQIHAQGMVFPVLVHELVKGVMEVLSAHGLPEDEKMAEYVIGKADFLGAEPWDMRLGPALWERFAKLFEGEDFKYKHNVYSELASLPVGEFNHKMREIMAGTNEGKEIISRLVEETKKRIKDDEYRDEIGDDDSEGFSLNDLDDIDINDLI
tara:strand:- start:78 stop:1289 length:1212 start_codon:yes stop_codon:yes gene_type:complete